MEFDKRGMPVFPEIRTLEMPLDEEQLHPLDSCCRTVQFHALPSEAELLRISEFLQDYPAVTLRVYGGYDNSIHNLDFLRFFPKVRRVAIDALDELENIDGLSFLREDLEQLALGRTRRRFSLAVLERFQRLNGLWLEGHTKDIEVISQFTELKKLLLRSITLPDLALLTPLSQLQSFALKLGGTQDLSHLAQIGCLEYIEIWMVRGLSDLTSLSKVSTLRFLFLQALKQVEQLPDFAQATNLVGLYLKTMKSVKDLSPIARSPNLETLWLNDMPQLQPEHVTCLAKHPKLKAVGLRTGSRRRDRAMREILQLPEAGMIDQEFRDLAP